MRKLSKAIKRALEAGAIPSARGKVKHYKPKRRESCDRYVGPAIKSGGRKDGTW